MPFSGDTFTHLFSWDQDPQRQEKIVNSRLEAEFDGVDTGLSSLSGRVTTLEAGGTGRALLSAARTYYVRTDGSDSNTGLANTSGGAFLTIQKAVNVIASNLDIGGQAVTIQVADGTYTGAVTLKNVVGFGAPGDLKIQGNSGTPANVVISTTSANCFKSDGVSAIWDIKDLKMQTTTSGHCLAADNNSFVRFGNVNFGACAQYHILSRFGSVISFISDYAISGGGASHVGAHVGGIVSTNGATVTLTGTPAFTNYAECISDGQYSAVVMTFSGSATGSRFSVTSGGVINTAGGGANYFPGNAAGSGTNFGASPYGLYL